MHNGFPELGDTSGMGIGTTTHAVISHDKFLTDPCEAARDVWECQGRNGAANGAVMRTSSVFSLSVLVFVFVRLSVFA